VTKGTESDYFSLGYTLWLYSDYPAGTADKGGPGRSPEAVLEYGGVLPHHCHDFPRFLPMTKKAAGQGVLADL
jgi:hypothetical protein